MNGTIINISENITALLQEISRTAVNCACGSGALDFPVSHDVIMLASYNILFALVLMFMIDRIAGKDKTRFLTGLLNFEKMPHAQRDRWIIERCLTLLFIINIIALVYNLVGNL